MNLDSRRYNARHTTYLDLCLLHPTDVSDARKGKGIETDRAHEASGGRGIRKKWDTLGHCHRDIRRLSRGDSGDGGAADGGRREDGGARDGGEGADKGHGDGREGVRDGVAEAVELEVGGSGERGVIEANSCRVSHVLERIKSGAEIFVERAHPGLAYPAGSEISADLRGPDYV
jgi:hypothetical protein